MILTHHLLLSIHPFLSLKTTPFFHTLHTVHCFMCYLMCTTHYRTVGARMAATTRTSQIRHPRLRTWVRTHSNESNSLSDLQKVCLFVYVCLLHANRSILTIFSSSPFITFPCASDMVCRILETPHHLGAPGASWEHSSCPSSLTCTVRDASGASQSKGRNDFMVSSQWLITVIPFSP